MTELENAKASIKQLKKQWDEMLVNIQTCDQRRYNFQTLYDAKIFEQGERLEVLEKWKEYNEGVIKNLWSQYRDFEQKVNNLQKKMGIVDDHV